ncbi:MAG: type II toxin-antitoxin system RelE/ParE family toxin [Candidatus Accumulibacter sp.]|nr:type II toxin-antitoxin system RelE/ParE family toxin [Candidatus Accumulibacter conexus]
MRAFKTRTFQRWAGKAGVTDASLLDALGHMERGLIDADLGGNLYKQRLALPGRGKSGSTRTIIATRFAGVLFFLYGFEKNARDNITARELALYQRLARELLEMDDARISAALSAQVLMEVTR